MCQKLNKTKVLYKEEKGACRSASSYQQEATLMVLGVL
jgi:hypothetical protein